MYLFPFQVGKRKDGHILSTADTDRETYDLLSKFGFKTFYINPENRTHDGKSKFYIQYENLNPPMAAMKVFTPSGNKLAWHQQDDPKFQHFKCACYVGVFGLPVPDTKLDDKPRSMIEAFRTLRTKYSNLEEMEFDEKEMSTIPYTKLLPDRNFFGYRIGKDRAGHILRSKYLESEIELYLTNFDVRKHYVDPENKTLDGFMKVYTQHQLIGGGLSVFTVRTPDGNMLDFYDRKGELIKCGCLVGFIGLPPDEKKEKGKELLQMFRNMIKKYHKGLEDVVIGEEKS
ncbi:MAG: hypothetical protein ABIH63_03415 [archaeon]